MLNDATNYLSLTINFMLQPITTQCGLKEEKIICHSTEHLVLVANLCWVKGLVNATYVLAINSKLYLFRPKLNSFLN